MLYLIGKQEVEMERTVNVGKVIENLLCERNMTNRELAYRTGVTEVTIGRYIKGTREPNATNLSNIADVLGVSTDYLLGYSQETKRKGVSIPILGKVVAGIPIEAVEEILDYEEITPELANTGTFFALKIQGESMEPKLSDGDIVIIKQQNNVENGEIAVVLVNGQDATVKQIIKHDNGIFLHGFNPSVYTDAFYNNQQIEELPVIILGKVVESRRKF